jgi:hypothetical protein
MNRYSMKSLLGCVAAVATLSTAGTALAVPYASAVTPDGGTGFDFILNEPADTVTVLRDGANAVVFAAAAAGSYNFDMSGFSTYSITVDHSAAAGWVESSTSSANPFLEFERANGLAVNKNPGSTSFGNFYVSQRIALPTISGRTMGDGVYILNANGVNAGGEAVNDASAAKNPGGIEWTQSSSSPWRLAIGEDDTVYISDWNTSSGPSPTGGMWHMPADGSSVTQLLAGNSNGPPPAPGQNHGAVVSSPIVSGSLGVDLKLWTIDENLEGSSGAGGGNHVWNYDIGTTTSNYNGTENLVLDTATVPLNSDGSLALFDLNVGVLADLDYDANTGNWIYSQSRNDGNETSILIMGSDVNGDPDATNILWNSKQFSIDNALDGATDDILFPEFDGNQDIFRYITAIDISPDGSTMAIHRREGSTATNPYLGTTPVILVPLDVNGLPDLDLSDTVGSPELGITQIQMVGDSNTSAKRLVYDLAGNLYASSGNDEKVTIFGPGGTSEAITSSDGTFTIDGVTYGGGGAGCGTLDLTGDLDCDDFVGITDLNIVLGLWNQNVTPGELLSGDPSGDGFVGIEDLNTVLGNWNAGIPPAASAVPEPASLALLGLGGIAMLKRRR